ncbi:type I-E CRISPR-associated protein Cas6/Cse3/CasE [Nocardiopsis deserti]|uniref:type I-E CRISPR-associated protein Cas6/Cse3/CasE n=1 Tax=Nocardiopsis deserti TaxID=2605988 RepID=UPI0012398E19|nr:type I-E CRISPR-associated protein Cas6/Cse3/CasE [Nocardiopsis deserti]
MYLSKLTPNTGSRAFRRDFADVHEMHRTLLSALPDEAEGTPARQAHGVLWRMDTTSSGWVVLVQSGTRPDWSQLPQGYLAEEAQTRSMDEAVKAVSPGQVLAFRLTANPTRIVRDPQAPRDARGKRVPLHDPKEQLGWLARKGEQHGFVIPAGVDGGMAVSASPCPPMVGYKGKDDRRNKITISAVRFDGQLVVTNADAFREAVRTGIGRAKAYGCGMVSLASLTSG